MPETEDGNEVVRADATTEMYGVQILTRSLEDGKIASCRILEK
jgi:hypothetical protein